MSKTGLSRDTPVFLIQLTLKEEIMEYTCNKENMELLVKELETTDKLQARSHLRNNEDAYCCLGISCDLYQRMTGKGQWTKFGLDNYYFFVAESERDLSATSLPDAVRNWLGLSNLGTSDLPIKLPSYRSDLQRDEYLMSAIGLNDTLRFTFKEIAAELRKTYLS